MSANAQPLADPDSGRAILGQMPFGAPPDTCIEAQMTAAKSTCDFINWVALDSKGIPRSLKFDYRREGRNASLIVPIPMIGVDEISSDSMVNITGNGSAALETGSVNTSAPLTPSSDQLHPTGISCPQCRELIEFRLRDLFSKPMLLCKHCELVLTLNPLQSRESLEALSQVQLALEQFEAHKSHGWKVTTSNTIEPQIESVGPPDPELPTSPILRAKPDPDAVYCFYNGNRYSTGDLLCAEGRLFQCFYGTWVDKGKDL